MRFVKIAGAAVALMYGLVVLAAWAGQGYLVYRPNPAYTEPTAAGLPGVEERWLEVGAGVRVLAWYAPAKPGQPTLLYFHGNAGTLARRADRFQRFMAEGWGLYVMAYRGYSGSGGEPSEAANVADALRAYADLASMGVSARDVIIYGESLGTGVATQVAAEKPLRALILDAPFTSVVEIGESRYPLLPVALLLENRYENIKHIGKIGVPLLIVHGEQDGIVPVEMGRQVFAAAQRAAAPKRLVTLPGAGHTNHMRYGSFEAIRSFVRDVMANGA